MAAVPPVPAVVPDLQVVFDVCGIGVEANRTRIIQSEGFTALADLAIIENDTDVTEMAKRLAGRIQADGRIHLRTVQIKRIQALFWWAHDKIKHGKALNEADTESEASKAIIIQDYPHDFAGACAYFSQQVSRIHGGAQLESQCYCKQHISAVDSGRGRGQGRFNCGGRGGHGNRDGLGGRGGCGGQAGRATIINGVDVSEPTRSFTADEWDSLQWNGGQA